MAVADGIEFDDHLLVMGPGNSAERRERLPSLRPVAAMDPSKTEAGLRDRSMAISTAHSPSPTARPGSPTGADEFRRLCRKELAVCGLLALALVFLYGEIAARRWIGMQDDTVMLSQTIESIAKCGRPRNEIYASVHVAFGTWSAPPEEVVEAPLLPSGDSVDTFRNNHPYMILYLLAPFAYIFPISTVVGYANAISFVMLLYFTYLLLRRRGVSALHSSIFVAMAMAHPAWSWSILGQLYSDRYFLGLGSLLLYLLATRERFTWGILAAALLSFLVNDRASVIVSIVFFAFAILRRDRPGKTRIQYAVFATLVAAAGAYLLFFFKVSVTSGQGQEALASFLPRAIINNLRNEALREKTIVFLVINGLLVVPALFSWKALLVAIPAISFNIFHTMGGAEKTGWYIHYHSMYFPLLVWASACGLAVLYRQCAGRASPAILAAFQIAVTAFYLTTVPYSLEGLRPSPEHWAETGLGQVASFVQSWGEDWSPDLKRLGEFIPPGAVVSCPPGCQAALYHGRKVYCYPIGIDLADHVVLSYTPGDTNPETRYGGAVSYRGRQSQLQLNSGLYHRLAGTGFDMEHPELFPGSSLAVFKRTPGRPPSPRPAG